MKGAVTFLDGDIVLGEGQAAQESGGTLTHTADMSVTEGTLTTEQAEVVFGEWLKGDKGDTPVISATKSGRVTTITADGVVIATINDGADGQGGSGSGTAVAEAGHRIKFTSSSAAGASGHKVTF